jgi:hypothetical protein
MITTEVGNTYGESRTAEMTSMAGTMNGFKTEGRL